MDNQLHTYEDVVISIGDEYHTNQYQLLHL